METVATGDVHAHHPRRTRSSGRPRCDPLPHLARRVRARAAREPRELPAPARGDARALLLRPRGSRAKRRRSPDRLEFDLTEELGYRYPDFSDREEPAIFQLAAICRHALDERYGLTQCHKACSRSPGRRARAHRRARPRGVLPPPPRGARARAPGGARGARHRLAAALPARRARPRELGRLDRLLPHRPLACRSGLERPLARALPEPRARLGAGHRPRLPARHPREAHRPRHRALRARPRGARRELRDVPLARRDPRRGKALGLPFAELERLARLSDGWNASAVGEEVARLPDGERKLELQALARVRLAHRRDRGTPAPRLAAPGRDDRLDAAADRARPRPARGHGRSPALPVGQGLVLGCGLPQDRPARPRDALGGRGLRRADRAHPRRGDRPLADPFDDRGGLRRHPARGHGRRVPDREPRADAEPPADEAGEPRRPHRPGRARPARGRSRGRRCIRTSTRGSGCARIRRTSGRSTTSSCASRCARRSASSSSRTRCSRSRSRSPDSRWERPRVCGAR